MAMSFLSTAATTTPSTSSRPLLPVRRLSGHKLPTTTTAVPSLSFPLRPRRLPPLSSLPPDTPRLSSSMTPTTTGLLSPIISTSRTLLFLLVASLLSFSLSGARPLPSLASPPPPTQQSEETEEQQESKEEESQQQQKEEDVEAEVEAAWQRQNGDDNEEEEEEEDDEEVQMYLDVLSGDPGDVDTLKCVLFAKMRRGDWGGALGYARRLREAEPGEEVEWRLMEALLHELKGDLAEAERVFREVLAEKPLLVRALHGLALCMHKRSEGPTVFEMLEKALQLAISERRVPEERNVKLLIAQVHVVKGELDVASEKLQNLINEDPRDFRSHLCQGIVYALLDRKEEADELFDTYRSLVPDEFPDKSFINDVIQAVRVESSDRLQKDFGSDFLSKK